jgi:protocatechuate 4,5-dioxygenase alpha subunit
MTAPHHHTIVLTGFMGTGKSTVGRLLSERLGFDHVDTDTLIEERHGPIEAIFQEQGEEAFRIIERGVASELADRARLVVSTGGGLMLDPANQATLGRAGRVFCLVAEPEEILARVTADAARVERPLLAAVDSGSRIRELLAKRADGYRQFTQIPTDGRSPGEIAAELAELLVSTAAPSAIVDETEGGTTMTAVDAPAIPGTTLFDGAQARKGLALNKMCFSFNQASNREAFAADPDAYMASYELTEAQREAVRRTDVLALLDQGGNIYYLAKLAGILGWDVQDVGANQTGLTRDEFIARLMTAATAGER